MRCFGGGAHTAVQRFVPPPPETKPRLTRTRVSAAARRGWQGCGMRTWGAWKTHRLGAHTAMEKLRIVRLGFGTSW